jgi:PKD repeat protein
MRNLPFLFLVLVLCLSQPLQSEEKDKKEKDKDKDSKPKLVLTAYPRQGFRPLRISFNATLENVSETDAEYYCLQEEWDFGDGAVSSEKPHCEPFGSDSRVSVTFFSEHIFDDPGNYTIRFKLGDPQKIRSNNLSILVLDRETGR